MSTSPIDLIPVINIVPAPNIINPQSRLENITYNIYRE